MGYQVIARKYRPQKFSDVVGQEHVIQTLRNAIQSGRIAHAYLFAGPRGTGKTTLARIFAKALNCQDGPRADFADDDPIACDIAEGTSLDVIEIDGASNNGVEQIRDLRDTVQYTPNVARFKIYIIDEVHMLSTQAFNALLKTLEEPPEHVKFMFATTEPEKILSTILSRCQRFDLSSIPTEKIAAQLKKIATNEGIEIENKALDAISRSADGGMRDAESTLDQLISFCGDKVTEEDVLGMFGLTSRQQIIDLAHSLLMKDIKSALILLDTLVSSGKDLSRLIGDLLNHFRNLLVYSVSGGDISLLKVSEAESDAIKQQEQLATPFQLGRILESFSEFESRLKTFSSKKIAMELCLMQVVESAYSTDINEVIQKLESLQSGEPVEVKVKSQEAEVVGANNLQEKKTPPLNKRPSKDPIGAPKKEDKTNHTSRSDNSDLDWKVLLSKVSEASGILEVSLSQAHLSRFDNQKLVIGFDPSISGQIVVINSPKYIKILKDAVRGLGFGDVDIELKEEQHPEGIEPEKVTQTEPTRETVIKKVSKGEKTDSGNTSFEEEESQEAQPVQPVKMDPEKFKSDPMIQKALEIFKGQIVDVQIPKE